MPEDKEVGAQLRLLLGTLQWEQHEATLGGG